MMVAVGWRKRGGSKPIKKTNPIPKDVLEYITKWMQKKLEKKDAR